MFNWTEVVVLSVLYNTGWQLCVLLYYTYYLSIQYKYVLCIVKPWLVPRYCNLLVSTTLSFFLPVGVWGTIIIIILYINYSCHLT